MVDRGHGWSEEFGYPRFLIWVPAVAAVILFGLGIVFLKDPRTHSGAMFVFWVLWMTGLVVGLAFSYWSLSDIRFRVRVNNEGIEKLHPRPTFQVRWHEIGATETTVQSLKLTAVGGEIVIPRTVPEYTELYKIISKHVPSSALHTTSGLPLLVHYKTFSTGSFALGVFWYAECFVLASAFYWFGDIPPLWYGVMVAFPLLGSIRGLYRRSKQYEFHADRIVARSAFESKEYLKSDLKDGYIEEAQRDEVTVPVLRLVFTNGDELEVHSGNITIEELYGVLKAHYSLI